MLPFAFISGFAVKKKKNRIFCTVSRQTLGDGRNFHCIIFWIFHRTRHPILHVWTLIFCYFYPLADVAVLEPHLGVHCLKFCLFFVWNDTGWVCLFWRPTHVARKCLSTQIEKKDWRWYFLLMMLGSGKCFVYKLLNLVEKYRLSRLDGLASSTIPINWLNFGGL